MRRNVSTLMYAYDKIMVEKRPYCFLCFRTDNERNLKTLLPHLRTNNTHATLGSINNKPLQICYMCEPLAVAAAKYRKATFFAASIDKLFRKMVHSDVYHKQVRTLMNCDGLEYPESEQLKSLRFDEEQLVEFRDSMQLKKTEVVVVDASDTTFTHCHKRSKRVVAVPPDIGHDMDVQHELAVSNSAEVIVVDDDMMSDTEPARDKRPRPRPETNRAPPRTYSRRTSVKTQTSPVTRSETQTSHTEAPVAPETIDSRPGPIMGPTTQGNAERTEVSVVPKREIESQSKETMNVPKIVNKPEQIQVEVKVDPKNEIDSEINRTGSDLVPAVNHKETTESRPVMVPKKRTNSETLQTRSFLVLNNSGKSETTQTGPVMAPKILNNSEATQTGVILVPIRLSNTETQPGPSMGPNRPSNLQNTKTEVTVAPRRISNPETTQVGPAMVPTRMNNMEPKQPTHTMVPKTLNTLQKTQPEAIVAPIRSNLETTQNVMNIVPMEMNRSEKPQMIPTMGPKRLVSTQNIPTEGVVAPKRALEPTPTVVAPKKPETSKSMIAFLLQDKNRQESLQTKTVVAKEMPKSQPVRPPCKLVVKDISKLQQPMQPQPKIPKETKVPQTMLPGENFLPNQPTGLIKETKIETTHSGPKLVPIEKLLKPQEPNFPNPMGYLHPVYNPHGSQIVPSLKTQVLGHILMPIGPPQMIAETYFLDTVVLPAESNTLVVLDSQGSLPGPAVNPGRDRVVRSDRVDWEDRIPMDVITFVNATVPHPPSFMKDLATVNPYMAATSDVIDLC